jgi:DNA/RNA endonuclease YhcR with UshA esterase domain
VTKATVAEIIAGPEGKLYEVRGVCASVSNTTYGNWYLKDDSTDKQLYIYGTVDASGKYNWASFNIEPGDVVTVQGSYVLYSGTTPEFVDAAFIKVEKALVKVVTEEKTIAKEGEQFDVKVAYKGDGIFPSVPEEYRSWVSIVDMQSKPGVASKIEPNPADTAIVKIAVLPNEGGDRTGSVSFSSGSSTVPYNFMQKGAIIETTADKINAAADGETVYRITGVVKSIANGKYGNIYIADYTGEVYVYGTYDAEGNRFDAFATPVKEGDIVTVCGVKTSYKDSPQMKNVTVEKHIQVAPVSVADFLAAPVAGDVYYSLTGTMANIVMDKADPTLQNAYGNFDIVDESGSVYVYGLLSGWGGPKQMFRELNLVEGDKITIVGVRADYKGTAQVGNAFFVKKIEE